LVPGVSLVANPDPMNRGLKLDVAVLVKVGVSVVANPDPMNRGLKPIFVFLGTPATTKLQTQTR